jgi:excinuclease ABC subunit A
MTKKNKIILKGARINNLKHIDLELPHDQLIVISGVSGSGKSSLTMDTIYAEGQRRYVESLSSYARQFLMRMKKPELDLITGLAPAIAIEQKIGNKNARSTVGTLTEIYDYIRMLYARIGITFDPITGEIVRKQNVSDIVDYIFTLEENSKAWITIPISKKEIELSHFEMLIQRGYARLFKGFEMVKIEDVLDQLDNLHNTNLSLIIDRFVIEKNNSENAKRIADSVDLALSEGKGLCEIVTENSRMSFSTRFESHGILFEEPSPHLFNFNNSYGACTVCEGYGQALGIDEQKVIPNQNRSILDDALACFKGEKLSWWKDELVRVAHKFQLPVHLPYSQLSTEHKKAIWEGNAFYPGILYFFKELEEQSYKVQNRVILARYRGKTTCSGCKGSRLRKEALYVRISNKKIDELVTLPINQLLDFFNTIQLSQHDWEVSQRLITEIKNRLQIMVDIGLSYLTLDRISSTLSGGEIQRIHLTRTLGSNLCSSLYILDEPSIGLHPKDTDRLIGVLKNLRDIGNTVIVVEHEEDVISAADYLVDVGPFAGVHGGKIVYSGPYKDIQNAADESLTAQYLLQKRVIPLPEIRRKFTKSIQLKGVRQHNLKGIDICFPLQTLTLVTGVSGSGKTTLVKNILFPAISKLIDPEFKEKSGFFEEITGDYQEITQIEMISQQGIGRSSRSNPVTYVKAYDAIRALFSKQILAKNKGLQPKHFSFNVEGGRCETCKGEGEIEVSMQFLADIRLSCEDCHGKRFQKEILDIQYRQKSIYDVLEMSIEEAMDFFSDQKEIIQKIKPLFDIGLGYLKLGQSSSTLSGGEAQRLKLASFLHKENSSDHILFIFDEPSTGLHFYDIEKLLKAMNALVELGHSVIIIEHDLDIIKCADYIIDLGPNGGDQGGKLLFSGTPEDLLQVKESHTAQFLRKKLKPIL